MGWLKRLFGGEKGSTDQGAPPPRAARSAVADAPKPFGYKCCWLALRCPSPEEAAAGGVDPLFREKTYPPGVGLVCAARI